MTNRFMISVAAAALIAGTGFANAQGTGTSRRGGVGRAADGAAAAAPSSERGGASSGSAMKHRDGGAAGMKGAEVRQSSKGIRVRRMKQASERKKRARA